MGGKRIVSPAITRGYPYPVCKKLLSCTPYKDIRVFHLYLKNLISPMFSHLGPDKNYVYIMHWLYRKSSSDVMS